MVKVFVIPRCLWPRNTGTTITVRSATRVPTTTQHLRYGETKEEMETKGLSVMRDDSGSWKVKVSISLNWWKGSHVYCTQRGGNHDISEENVENFV